MPIQVADASVAIRGDLSGFTNDLKGAERQTQTLGQKLGDALSFKNILRTGAIFGLGTKLPGMLRDLVGFAGDAAANFRELEQTGRTVDSVFGDAADTIHKWGENAAEAAGLSKREVQGAAAAMGSTLINMGLDAQTAADLTVQAQQRAADLAVAYGRETGDAILGVSALLRGEYDTIEKFGVRIKQADVNSRILALGLDTSTDAAKRQAEAIATLDLFFQQTASSAGRFADNNDDAAVRMERAGAKWDNFVDQHVGPAAQSILDGLAIVGEAFVTVAEAPGKFIEESNDPRIHQLADQLGIEWSDALHMIRGSMNETGQTWDTTVDGMLTSAYELEAESWNTYQSVASAAAEGMASVKDSVNDAADTTANAIPDAVKRHWQDIYDAGVETMDAYNAGIFDTQDDIFSTIDNLIRTLDEDHLAPLEEIAELRGRRADLMLRLGIAQQEHDLGAAAAIQDVIDDINRRLATLNGWVYGKNLVITLANGISQNLGTASLASAALARVIGGHVRIESEPPNPNSPLRGITKWGGNIVDTISEGIYGNLDTGQSAAMALAGSLIPQVGAMGAAAGGGGAGTTINNYLVVEGVPKQVRGADELWAGFEQMSDRSLVR